MFEWKEEYAFAAKLAELKRNSESIDLHSLNFIHETLSFLARWIIHHIMMMDLEDVFAIKSYRLKHTSLL